MEKRDRNGERERERRRNTLFALSDRDFFTKLSEGPRDKNRDGNRSKKPEECLGSCHTATIHTTMLRERQGRLRESRGDSDPSKTSGHG